MKNIILFICLFVLLVVPAHAYIDQSTAVVRVMNKAAGKSQTVNLPVGRTVQFEKLALTVRSCKQTDPFQAEDFFAFVEIKQNDNVLIFSNWMRRNEPGINPLQNADYDVWLVKCE